MIAHDWKAILNGALPCSLLAAIIFTNITSNWKWAALFLVMVFSSWISSFKTTKRSDLLTSAAIVLLVGIAMANLSAAGIV